MKMKATVEGRTFGSHDVVELSVALLLAEEGRDDKRLPEHVRLRFRLIAAAIRKACS
jgi:hypothetical protein